MGGKQGNEIDYELFIFRIFVQIERRPVGRDVKNVSSTPKNIRSFLNAFLKKWNSHFLHPTLRDANGFVIGYSTERQLAAAERCFLRNIYLRQIPL